MAATVRRRPFLGRKGSAMVFFPTLALVLAVTKGSVFDTPQKGEQENRMQRAVQYSTYMQQNGSWQSGADGLRLAFLFFPLHHHTPPGAASMLDKKIALVETRAHQRGESPARHE